MESGTPSWAVYIYGSVEGSVQADRTEWTQNQGSEFTGTGFACKMGLVAAYRPLPVLARAAAVER